MFGRKERLDYDPIDLQSLLFNAGVAGSAQRAALLDIYGKMSTEIGTVDLLHTAFLTKQRILRGFPAGQSIRDACIDVYVRTRPMYSDRVSKERLIALIDEAIERHVARDEEQQASSSSVIDLDAATWSVSNLQKDLRLTVIRQQGLLLNAAVKMHVSRSEEQHSAMTKLLNELCDVKEDEEFTLVVDVADVLQHLLLNFFEQSSQEDAQLRKEWMLRLLRRSAVLGDLARKSELMAKVISSFRFRDDPPDPWNLWQLVGRRVIDGRDGSVCRDANKLLLLLYACNTVLKKDASLTRDEKIKDKSVMSVKEYTNAIRKGTYLLYRSIE